MVSSLLVLRYVYRWMVTRVYKIVEERKSNDYMLEEKKSQEYN